MTKHDARDVFTPNKPARLTFVERGEINDRIVDALRTPGKQLVVYGPSGSGKTTLLVNKLEQLYEDHVTTRCTASSTFEGLLLSAFDKLGVFYLTETTDTASSRISGGLVADYKAIKASLGVEVTKAQEQKQERAVKLQLTPERLAEFLGAAGCCWVVEDFHRVAVEEKKHLADTMKLFVDAAGDYNDVKIIAVGAVNTARQVIECSPEMRGRVSEIGVPLMAEDEIREIMDAGEPLLNLKLGDARKIEIAEYASGLATVCHQLCLNVCFAASIEETHDAIYEVQDEDLQKAVKRYTEDASDSLKAVFDKALVRHRQRKFDNARLILAALSRLDAGGATHAEILAEIRKKESSYPGSNLSVYLQQLQTEDRGEVVQHDTTAHLYDFSNPFYRAHAMCLFGTFEGSVEIPTKLGKKDLFMGFAIADVLTKVVAAPETGTPVTAMEAWIVLSYLEHRKSQKKGN